MTNKPNHDTPPESLETQLERAIERVNWHMEGSRFMKDVTEDDMQIIKQALTCALEERKKSFAVDDDEVKKTMEIPWSGRTRIKTYNDSFKLCDKLTKELSHYIETMRRNNFTVTIINEGYIRKLYKWIDRKSVV